MIKQLLRLLLTQLEYKLELVKKGPFQLLKEPFLPLRFQFHHTFQDSQSLLLTLFLIEQDQLFQGPKLEFQQTTNKAQLIKFRILTLL